jgi:hypothetical protein
MVYALMEIVALSVFSSGFAYAVIHTNSFNFAPR